MLMVEGIIFKCFLTTVAIPWDPSHHWSRPKLHKSFICIEAMDSKTVHVHILFIVYNWSCKLRKRQHLHKSNVQIKASFEAFSLCSSFSVGIRKIIFISRNIIFICRHVEQTKHMHSQTMDLVHNVWQPSPCTGSAAICEV